MTNKAIGNILYLYAQHRYQKIQKYVSCPIKIQEENLKKILNRARDTALGRYFGFKDIKSISDYQRKIPLMDYQKMKPWIDGCLEGRSNHIWPERIRYFALTSGTTSGTSKYIPVSQDMIKKNKRAVLDCILFYLVKMKDKTIFNGKMLFLGGSTSLGSLPHNLFSGDMSGIMSRFIPFYAARLYEPGKELALIPDWEEKIKRIVENIKDKDIRVVCGVPSWLLVLFEYLLSSKKKEKVCQIWKDLSLLIYGGLDFSLYERVMQDIIGKDIYYIDTYFASEAFMGIQDTPSLRGVNEDGLLLMLDYGIFYEFVRVEDIKKDNPRRYTVADVAKDVNYAIVITNINGLYSYVIGDTVKFVSNSPLRIKVTGRLEDFINALGEHVITEEVEDAITKASLYTGALINNFTIAPYYPRGERRPPGHQWLIEFTKRPDDLNKFIDIIDEILCLRNDDYRAHRKEGFGMSPPSIYELKEGTFYRWHKDKDMLGGQHKTPHLKNDRKMAEELIRINQKNNIE